MERNVTAGPSAMIALKVRDADYAEVQARWSAWEASPRTEEDQWASSGAALGQRRGEEKIFTNQVLRQKKREERMLTDQAKGMPGGDPRVFSSREGMVIGHWHVVSNVRPTGRIPGHIT